MSLTPVETDKYIRIVQCLTCKSMSVLPDYKGRPEDDVFLNDVVEQHGGEAAGHRAALHRVVESIWDDPRIRRQIVKEMWSGVTGFTPEYYAARDTFKEDAMKCWQQHNRPGVSTHLCNDYHNDNRRIGNPAYRDRVRLSQELRIEEIKHSGPKVYLCDGYCPYSVDVQRMKADKYGDFSEKLT